MIRALASLLAALEFVAPHFKPRHEAAELLVGLGERCEIDPFTTVAVVENESHWDPTARGKAGEVGLGQVKPNCSSPEECERVVEHLLDWRVNLIATSTAFQSWRAFCKERVGTGLAKFWLSGYQGYDATRGTTCGHKRVGKRWVPQPIPHLVRKVLARRAELARRFGGV